MQRILVVEDDPKLREGLRILLKKEGYSPSVVEDGIKAIERIKREEFDMVISDLVMPGANGMEVLRTVKESSPMTEVIIITAYGTVDSAVHAMKMGARDYILKPFNVGEIRNKVLRTLEEMRVERGVKGEREIAVPDEGGIEMLKSLSNPIRRKIMDYLHSREKARFTDIQNYLGLGEPAKLGYHLRRLKECNLISQDQNRHYCVTEDGKRAVKTVLSLEE